MPFSSALPTSFQLRWDLRRRSPPHRRTHPRLVWGYVGRGEGWVEDSGGGCGGEKGGKGTTGVGLAGIFLAAGIAFASLSLNGMCQQIEPLTAYHSDEKVDAVKFERDMTLPTDDTQNSKTVPQVLTGRILVPAMVNQIHGQAFAALQTLMVIEGDAQPGDICTRREYARWLVVASNAFSRNPASKVYPAMYIENVTELAFDDITPEDPDFSYIQGLAEAGLISSKLSCSDTNESKEEDAGTVIFAPESALSRQDLVSWKMALERKLPQVDKKMFHQCCGYIDIDKINPEAWSAIVADLSSGENGIISLAFGFTRLFQPEKPVTKAQAAVSLSIGDAAEVVGEELTRIEAELLAEAAVANHIALVAEVEKDLNANFEKELAAEKEKVDAIEKLAEETKVKLEKLREEREEENNSLVRERATVEAEMEALTRLRNKVEEQLQNVMSDKVVVKLQKDRVSKLLMEAESENQVIVQLQHELEIERNALDMARSWAEDEAKRAREQARALEEARERWERYGIKVIVDEELQHSASDGVTFLQAGKRSPVEATQVGDDNLLERLKFSSRNLIKETKVRAENLLEKLKTLAMEVKGKSAAVIEHVIQKIETLISEANKQISEASDNLTKRRNFGVSKAGKLVEKLKTTMTAFASGIRDSGKKEP